MNIIRVHVVRASVAAFAGWYASQGFAHVQQVDLPDGAALFLIAPISPFDRAAITLRPEATILPGPSDPQPIGVGHATRFAHVPTVNATMTPRQLLAALHAHPGHPHPMLDPDL